MSGKAYLSILAALGLAACNTTPAPEPVVRTVTVNVPTPVACVPAALGAPPAYVDTDAALRAAHAPEDRYQLVVAGRLQRIARAGEVEPVITACRLH